jgi:hypothetical protein
MQSEYSIHRLSDVSAWHTYEHEAGACMVLTVRSLARTIFMPSDPDHHRCCVVGGTGCLTRFECDPLPEIFHQRALVVAVLEAVVGWVGAGGSGGEGLCVLKREEERGAEGDSPSCTSYLGEPPIGQAEEQVGMLLLP